jgi:hypothetical protein
MQIRACWAIGVICLLAPVRVYASSAGQAAEILRHATLSNDELDQEITFLGEVADRRGMRHQKSLVRQESKLLLHMGKRIKLLCTVGGLTVAININAPSAC